MASQTNATVHPETIDRLMSVYQDDSEMLEVIEDALESFEKYHQSIYTLEIKRKMFARGAMTSETYRSLIPELDSVRTRNHNKMLSGVNLLNRLAKQNNLPPFYDGEVSEEKPIRTWVADAVLEYVRQVIDDRVTGGR